jgi:exodeoxyribonuclease VII large subunit
MNKKVDSYSQRLQDIKNRNMFKNPQEIYSQKEMDLDMSKERLNYSANRIIMEKESRFNRLKDSYYLRNPYDFADNKERIYTELSQRLKENMDDVIKSKERSLIRAKEFYTIRNPKALTKNKEQRFLEIFNKLELLNPMLTIKRGYTLTKKDGKVVSKSKDLEKGDRIEIEFSDGNVESEVV